MDQWIEIAKVYGPLGFFSLALGWFLYKKVWPLITQRLEDADRERADFARRLEDQGQRFTDALKTQREADDKRWEEQGKLFSEALRTQNVFAAETHKESVNATREVAREVKTLAQFLKNGNGR